MQNLIFARAVANLLIGKFVTMNDNRKGEKKMLKKGDKVIMNDRYIVPEKNKNKVFTIRCGPQKIGGTDYMFLDEYSGCYAADGLTKIGIDYADTPDMQVLNRLDENKSMKDAIETICNWILIAIGSLFIVCIAILSIITPLLIVFIPCYFIYKIVLAFI